MFQTEFDEVALDQGHCDLRAHPSTPPLAGSLGTLDAAGKAAAELALGPASEPALAGLTATHAFAAFDPLAGALSAVSNPISVLLVP